VEIGDDTLYIMITVTGSYDDLGAGVEYVGVVAVHPAEDGLQLWQRTLCGLRCGVAGCAGRLLTLGVVVGLPLGHFHFELADVGVCQNLQADVVEAFERADARCAYGCAFAAMAHQGLDDAAWHIDPFAVHLVAFDFFALDGLEGPGAYM